VQCTSLTQRNAFSQPHLSRCTIVFAVVVRQVPLSWLPYGARQWCGDTGSSEDAPVGEIFGTTSTVSRIDKQAIIGSSTRFHVARGASRH
jgi:hypothetical protein